MDTPAVASDNAAAASRDNPQLAAIVAWIVPGAGHFLLRRRQLAAIYFGLVLSSLIIGWLLEGNLYRVVPGQPLSILATLGSMGLGLPYFLLRFLAGYQGDVMARGFEYGTAFILTGGLMNWLLVLDAWDIARGRKD